MRKIVIIFFLCLIFPKLSFSKLAPPKWESGYPKIDDNTIILKWKPVPNAIVYRVYHDNVKLVEKFNNYEHKINLPRSAGKYLYWVRAVDLSGEEGYIDPVKLEITIQHGIPIYTIYHLKPDQYEIVDNKVLLKEDLISGLFQEKESIKEPKTEKPLMSGYGKVLSVTDKDFKSKVLNSSIPVLVDFWAPWCGPCHSIHSILESLAKDYTNRVMIVRLNTDENNYTAQKYRISGLPTLVMFKNGKEVGRLTGAVPKKYIKNLIEENID